jgi:ribosomal protein S27E
MVRVLCENCDNRTFYVYEDEGAIWSLCTQCGEVLRNYGK